MDPSTEGDEFERIRIAAEIERYRGLIAQYDVHQSYYRTRVEDNRYILGRLDERLEGKP
jgi:hypothetical protein